MKPYYEKDGITIFHGDCLDVVAALEVVDVVLTDPPWELSGNELEISNPGVAPIRQSSKTLRKGAVGQFDAMALEKIQAIAKHDCLFLCGYKELADVIKACARYRGTLVWHKPNAVPAVFYPAKIDISFIVWSASKSLLYGHQHWPSMIFSVPFPSAGCMASERFIDATGKALHPCQGPVALYRRLLAPFGSDRLVLDAYAGTGTTLRAAKDLGMRAIGIEREERWCELAAKRLAQGVFNFEGHGSDFPGVIDVGTAQINNAPVDPASESL